MHKEVSAGIVMFYSGEVLLGHPTNSSWSRWNIPKGHVEEGESFIEAAVRETFEETNILFRAAEIRDEGRFSYIKTKDLYLFSFFFDAFMNPPPSFERIKCTSLVNNTFPEFDKFAWVDVRKLNRYVSKELFEIITTIYKRKSGG